MNTGALVPRVHCTKCNRPVDHVEVTRMELTEEIVIKASCHGDTDEMIISREDQMTLGNKGLLQIQFGVGQVSLVGRLGGDK